MRKRAFTMIELLVVLVIIAILAAIIFPAIIAARKRAHMSACSQHLRQAGLQTQMPDEKQHDMRCPHPRGGSGGEYVRIDGVFGRGDYSTAWAYCTQHLDVDPSGSGFKVPLEGSMVVLIGPSSTRIVSAKSVRRYSKSGNNWVQVDETGTLPDNVSTRWRFPGEQWPPN